MRSYGPRRDADGVVAHPRVASVASYQLVTTLWTRRVAGGSIRCELLRAVVPAKRIVRLVAEYDDAGVACQHVAHVEDPLEEAATAAKLEAKIIAASRRAAPVVSLDEGPPAPPSTPANSDASAKPAVAPPI